MLEKEDIILIFLRVSESPTLIEVNIPVKVPVEASRPTSSYSNGTCKHNPTKYGIDSTPPLAKC